LPWGQQISPASHDAGNRVVGQPRRRATASSGIGGVDGLAAAWRFRVP
jgi:hypothetical protein